MAYQHEDISTVPRGYKVRTKTLPSGVKLRLAFPPGRRQTGSGQLVSILHPNRSNHRGTEAQRNIGKTATIEQVEAKQTKAVNFLRDVVGDDDKADEIEALSPEEYAERKKLTISNPKNRKSEIGNRKSKNPDDTAGDREMFETFHGQQPREIIRVQENDIGADTYTALGDLWEMKLNCNGENYKLEFAGCHVKLCSSADGRQLYTVGGDQNLSNCLPKGAPDKEFVSLGIVKKISYVTRKKFDKFQESVYEHKFGEEGGEPPWAFYARTQKRIFIVDGTYKVEAPGIID